MSRKASITRVDRPRLAPRPRTICRLYLKMDH
jgi:hypothetical protein